MNFYPSFETFSPDHLYSDVGPELFYFLQMGFQADLKTITKKVCTEGPSTALIPWKDSEKISKAPGHVKVTFSRERLKIEKS